MRQAFDLRRGWNFGPAIGVVLVSGALNWWPLAFTFNVGPATARLPGPLSILLALTALGVTNRSRISVGRQALQRQREGEPDQ